MYPSIRLYVWYMDFLTEKNSVINPNIWLRWCWSYNLSCNQVFNIIFLLTTLSVTESLSTGLSRQSIRISKQGFFAITYSKIIFMEALYHLSIWPSIFFKFKSAEIFCKRDNNESCLTSLTIAIITWGYSSFVLAWLGTYVSKRFHVLGRRYLKHK